MKITQECPQSFSVLALQFSGPALSLHCFCCALQSPGSLSTQSHGWGQLLLSLLFFPAESELNLIPLWMEEKWSSNWTKDVVPSDRWWWVGWENGIYELHDHCTFTHRDGCTSEHVHACLNTHAQHQPQLHVTSISVMLHNYMLWSGQTVYIVLSWAANISKTLRMLSLLIMCLDRH